MEGKIEKHKSYSDQERYEWCRKLRISGMSLQKFARENGINRETLRGWYTAYKNINGKFINVNLASMQENVIVDNDMMKTNILSECEKIKKSTHFSRFDHSIVVVEYKGIKITTSLEQAEYLLGKMIG